MKSETTMGIDHFPFWGRQGNFFLFLPIMESTRDKQNFCLTFWNLAGTLIQNRLDYRRSLGRLLLDEEEEEEGTL